MRRKVAILLCAYGASFCMAQQWVPAGLPGNPINPRTVATNTAGDTLYYGGLLPAEGDGSNWWLTNSVFRYSNGQWDTLGVIPGDVLTLIVHKDTLFAGGPFTACGGQPCAGIAYHDGASWQPYGDLGSGVLRLRIIDDTLYAVGSFSTADGTPAPGVARRVGGQWTGVGQIEPDGTGSITARDIVKYNDELVIVGPMTVGGIRGIFRLVGNDWLPLGPGILGGLSNAGCLAVYQGDLYVSGQISLAAGNAGKDIMRWDGTQFHPLGSGLQYILGNDSQTCTGQVMMVHDDLLWVGSGCYYAGGVPAIGLATWDGTQWCGVPGDLGGETGVRDFAFYQDTLFLAFISGFGPMAGAAKFIGESYVGECGLWVWVEDHADPYPSITPYPNPATTTLSLHGLPAGTNHYQVLDVLGRQVAQGSTTGEPIPVEHLRPGTYLLCLHDGAGGTVGTVRFMKE